PATLPSFPTRRSSDLQDQFLPGETLPAAVRISNRSGQTLRLGAEEDWLTFSVEARESAVVAKIGEVPVRGEFVVESSQRATKHVDRKSTRLNSSHVSI